MRVLVLAPHPDDEIFGCGGALALYHQQSARIHVHVLTDGAGYATVSERSSIYGIRQAETQAALQSLGVEAASFAGFPDRSLSSHASLAHHVLQQIRQCNADVVFAPSLWEIHPDHLAVGRAAWAAATHMQQQGSVVPTLLFYEIGSPQRTDLLIDITSVWPDKLQAMQCFPSQQHQQDYARHIAALNVYRTYTLPPFVSHAEAFSVVTPEKLAALRKTGEDPAQRAMNRWTESALVAATVHIEELQARQLQCRNDAQQAQQQLFSQVEQAQHKIETLRAELDQLKAQSEQVNREKEQLLASTSWRLTEPLRWLGRRLRH